MSKDRSQSTRLKDLPKEDRPQERLERLGAPALADRELLAMIIRSGTSKKDVLTLADEMLTKAGSLSGLLRWDTSDFQQIIGIGKIKALQLSTQIISIETVAFRSITCLPTSNLTYSDLILPISLLTKRE